jgi:hypothetical protein
MVSHQVAAAFFAVLPLDNLSLLEHAHIVGSRSYPHGIRLPKTKSIYRPTNDKKHNGNSPWLPVRRKLPDEPRRKNIRPCVSSPLVKPPAFCKLPLCCRVSAQQQANPDFAVDVCMG